MAKAVAQCWSSFTAREVSIQEHGFCRILSHLVTYLFRLSNVFILFVKFFWTTLLTETDEMLSNDLNIFPIWKILTSIRKLNDNYPLFRKSLFRIRAFCCPNCSPGIIIKSITIEGRRGMTKDVKLYAYRPRTFWSRWRDILRVTLVSEWVSKGNGDLKRSNASIKNMSSCLPAL